MRIREIGSRLFVSVVLLGMIGTARAGKPPPDSEGIRRPVQELVTNLRERSELDRDFAARDLWELGVAARDAAPALLKALHDPLAHVRLYAAGALLRIDEAHAKDALPVLVAVLRDPKAPFMEGAAICSQLRPVQERLIAGLLDMVRDAHPMVRVGGSMALENVSPAARSAAPLLAGALGERDADVRLSAAKALLRIDPTSRTRAFPVLEDLLGAPSYSTRVDAARSLVRAERTFRPKAALALAGGLRGTFEDRLWVASDLVEFAPEQAGDVANALAEDLKAADADSRRRAAEKLGSLGRYAEGAARALRAAMSEKDTPVALAAAEALVRVKPQDARALLQELAELRDEGMAALLKICKVLIDVQEEELGEEKKPESRRRLEDEIVKSLSEQIDKPLRPNSDLLQIHAALRLAERGDRGKDAVPTLVAVLRDAKGPLRDLIVFALGKLGPDARVAVPALLQVHRDSGNSIGLRREAAEALCVGWRAGLRSDRAEERAAAAWGLGQLGPTANLAVVPLGQALLEDSDPTVRRNAAWALGQLGAVTPDAIGALLRALERENASAVRKAAADALSRIGKPAVAPLSEALKDSEKTGLRYAALPILASIGPDADSAVPALVTALRDQDEDFASVAARVLSRIGRPAAAPLLQLLRKKKSGDQEKSLAARALAGIGEPAVPLLCEALRDKGADIRLWAAEILRKIGSQGAAAVAPLYEIVKDREEEAAIRSAAVEAMVQIGKPATGLFRQALKGRDKWVRRKAAESLGQLGLRAADAVGDLSEASKDKDRDVRAAAAAALGQIGPEARSAVPSLVAALADEDGRVRRSAANALGEIGPAAQSAIPALLAALKGTESSLRIAAASALSSIAPDAVVARAPLRDALKSQDAKVRLAAAVALGVVGREDPSTGDALLEALHDEEDEVRLAAAVSLGQISAPPRTAVEPLVRMLRGEGKGADPSPPTDPKLRQAAAETLSRIGEAAVSPLVDALAEKDAVTRTLALWALGTIGPKAQAAVGPLCKLLEEERQEKSRRQEEHQERSRRLAAWALAAIGPRDEKAIPPLLRALKSAALRDDAAEALGQIGKPGIAALVEALKDQNHEVRLAAAKALGEIGLEARGAVGALWTALWDSNLYVRYAAASALTKIGPQAEDVPALLDCLQDDRSSSAAIRLLGRVGKPAVPGLIAALKKHLALPPVWKWQTVVYLEALAEVGPDAAPAVVVLEEALGVKDTNVRQAALRALGALGTEAGAASGLLESVLRDPEPSLRLEAALALARVSPAKADEALAVLCEALQDDKDKVRIAAARAFADLGVQGRTAIPILREALREPDSDVRSEILKALRHLESEGPR